MELEKIFPEKEEAILAESVINYLKRDFELTREPVGLESPSFIATIKEDWQELVDKRLVTLSKISDSGYGIRSRDVEKKLPEILQKLVKEDYLEQSENKYRYNQK